MPTACALQLCCQQQPSTSGSIGGRRSVQHHATALSSLSRASIALPCGTASLRGRQVRQATASAAASAAASLSSSDGEDAAVAGARHAFLHDFCMCIPYGALLLAGGLAGKLCGWGQPAAVMAVLGAAQVVLSNLSLRAWRAGKATTPITLSEAGLAGWLAYYAYRAVQQGVSRMFMGALLGLSAAMALFLVYNVVAGGNPPRRGPQAAAVAAEAAAAAEPEPAATS